MKIEIEITTEEKQYSEEEIAQARKLMSDEKLMALAAKPEKKGISSIQDIKDAEQALEDGMECCTADCKGEAECAVCDMCEEHCQCNHKEEPKAPKEKSMATMPKTKGYK